MSNYLLKQNLQEKLSLHQDEIQTIATLVERYRKNTDGELEMRFGCVVQNENGKAVFRSGVQKTFFDRCLRNCESYSHWKDVEDWRLSRDVFCNKTRSRTYFDQDGNEEKTEVVQKRRLKKEDLELGGAAEFTDNPENCRFCLSSESQGRLEDVYNCSLCKVKLRKCFLTESGWSFEFSKDWTYQNTEDAANWTTDEDFVYNIEIELADRSYLCNQDEHIASSLLLKSLDFVPGCHVSV